MSNSTPRPLNAFGIHQVLRFKLDTSLLDAGNIEERLTLRNFMESLRSGGVDTGGPAAFSAADRQAFGNRLDSLLARLAKA